MYIYKIEQSEERMIKYSWFFLFRNKNRRWGHLYDIHILWHTHLHDNGLCVKYRYFTFLVWKGNTQFPQAIRPELCGNPIILILFSIEIHRNVHSLKYARICFSPNRICPYMNRIIDTALIWENRGQRTVFSHILCSDFLRIG